MILMAIDQLHHWNGDNGDYDRACTIYDYAGRLTVGVCDAIVFGEHHDFAHNAPNGTWQIIEWIYGKDTESVLHHLSRADRIEFPASALVVDFGSRDVVLMDSVLAGDEAENENTLRLILPASKCEVRTVDWKPDNDTWLIVQSFTPISN